MEKRKECCSQRSKRRRLATLQTTIMIPEHQSVDIERQRHCSATLYLKSHPKRFYTNPWFFHKTKRRRRDVAFLVLSAAYAIMVLHTLRCNLSSKKHPRSHSFRHHSLVFAHIDKSLPQHELLPDYGGLQFSSLCNASHFRRTISQPSWNDASVDSTESNRHPEHALKNKSARNNCRQPSWQYRFYPTCNIVHEDNYVADPSSYQIGNGYYREAWLVNHTESSVLKMLKIDHPYNDMTMKQVIIDAVVMEQLSSSPRIMDMYSLCGTSLTVKSMPVNVEKEIVPPGEWEDGNEPRNQHLRPTTKLQMALEMAESLGDLHGFKRGIIVHGDVQLGQWLRESANGTLVLGDFNLARPLGWDERKKQYCTYKVGRGHGSYRAPEEVQSKELNEKLDVFSFGNNVYAILSGRRVYFERNGNKHEQKLAMTRYLEIAKPTYTKRSFAEAKLVELLELCWEFDPSKRISIFEAVRFLRKAVKDMKQEVSILRYVA